MQATITQNIVSINININTICGAQCNALQWQIQGKSK